METTTDTIPLLLLSSSSTCRPIGITITTSTSSTSSLSTPPTTPVHRRPRPLSIFPFTHPKKKNNHIQPRISNSDCCYSFHHSYSFDPLSTSDCQSNNYNNNNNNSYEYTSNNDKISLVELQLFSSDSNNITPTSKINEHQYQSKRMSEASSTTSTTAADEFRKESTRVLIGGLPASPSSPIENEETLKNESKLLNEKKLLQQHHNEEDDLTEDVTETEAYDEKEHSEFITEEEEEEQEQPIVQVEKDEVVATTICVDDDVNDKVDTTTAVVVEDSEEKEKSDDDDNNNSHILVLITKFGNTYNQQRAFTMLDAQHIPYKVLDGSDVNNKDERNHLFTISTLRAIYPQFFLITTKKEDETTSFLGDWDTIEGINDANSLPKEILNNNPHLLTWDRLFPNRN